MVSPGDIISSGWSDISWAQVIASLANICREMAAAEQAVAVTPFSGPSEEHVNPEA